MTEAHDLGGSFREVYDSFRATVARSERQWAAKLLKAYPWRSELEIEAAKVRFDLSSDAVEVNALSSGMQATLAKAPKHAELVIPDSDSLCVLTIGSGRALEVSDVQGDPLTQGHNAMKLGLKSWASWPIFIDGFAAGTVCALEIEEKREWTEADKHVLELAAGHISRVVTDWSKTETRANLYRLTGTL